ncbi:hypothetical protein MX031_14710, partial [Ralstonia solanacearum]|uniref:hypothetical protein n=1 Tax=Ralstonia solanacearum TaxID=305 RepID=UPI00202A7616
SGVGWLAIPFTTSLISDSQGAVTRRCKQQISGPSGRLNVCSCALTYGNSWSIETQWPAGGAPQDGMVETTLGCPDRGRIAWLVHWIGRTHLCTGGLPVVGKEDAVQEHNTPRLRHECLLRQ